MNFWIRVNILSLIGTHMSKVLSKPVTAIITIICISLTLRIYFTAWNLPTNSSDSLLFMIEGLQYSKGDFSNVSNRPLWPLFLSFFFLVFRFENNLEYMNLVRVVAIMVSLATIPVVYLISKKYVTEKYAILAALFFAIEPNLIENAIFGMTEPLFILLGTLSFYFIIQKNQKYQLLSFIFAGLAFDTRLNGITLIILLIISLIINRNQVKKQSLFYGVLIFLVLIFPAHFLVPIQHGFAPFPIIEQIGTIVVHGTTTYSTDISNPTTNLLILNAIKNELSHILRISMPFLIMLVPYGIILALKNNNYKNKILFLVIIISLIIAIPQYTVSNEYRNLFFIIPFLCIFSAIAFEKLTEKIDLKNIFLVLLILGLILISTNFLRERYSIDEEYFIEKDNFGKYVANNLDGNITGNIRLEIIRNMADLKSTTYFFNEKLSLFDPGFPIDSVSKLMNYCIQNKIDYMIIEQKKVEKHFTVFNKIEFNEDNLPFLKEIYDTEKLDYKKLKVKIFKINYEEYQDSLN